MAKISANGAREVGRWRATRHTNDGYVIECLFVLTNDGRLLRRVTGEHGSGYTIAARFRKVIFTEDRAEQAVEKYLDARCFAWKWEPVR